MFWLAVWQILAMLVDKSILLPSPVETVSVFFSLACQFRFWLICFTSVKSIFLGVLLGVLLGILIGALSYLSSVARYFFEPLLSLVKATPIASIIILFLVWIGKNHIPYVISLMMVTPIVASNVLEGLENIDKKLWEVTRVYKLSFSKSWKVLYRHSLMPYFMASLKSGIALAWKAGIAAEVLCTPDNSIGKMLYESQIYLETPTLFAWTLTVILLSYILEKLVLSVSYRLLGGVANA